MSPRGTLYIESRVSSAMSTGNEELAKAMETAFEVMPENLKTLGLEEVRYSRCLNGEVFSRTPRLVHGLLASADRHEKRSILFDALE
jgi:hypothetical protein